MKPYFFRYDIHEKKVINDCTLYPTQLDQTKFPWLYARNNKYGDETSIDQDKIGKWMIFLAKNHVNPIWNKIKAAIVKGDLWSSKVSTNNPEQRSHAIMVYTKDYTDLDDVINVLDFLESSGIKPCGVHLKYKTDKQTRAGVYRGGKKKPWIYSSDTIKRQQLVKQRTMYRYRGASSSSECGKTFPSDDLQEESCPSDWY